jgi:Orotidine-5''-phosphate decarboxylase
VGVVTEWRDLRRAARAVEPGRLVLAVGRRPQERRDDEARRPPLEQALEGGPDAVVERSLGVAGHDRVAFKAPHVRIFAASNTRLAAGLVAAAAIVPRLWCCSSSAATS